MSNPKGAMFLGAGSGMDSIMSPAIASQFPMLYQEEGPLFILFVKAYFKWMEQEGNVLAQSRKLLQYRDIDATIDDFLPFFRNKYMKGLPASFAGDQRDLVKHVKELFSNKGNVRGLEALFLLMDNAAIEVYSPSKDILRASDGTWIQPKYLEVSATSFNPMFLGESVTGQQSKATAIVEDVQVRYVRGKQINLFYLSNIHGDFKNKERILNANVVSNPLLSPKVIGSLNEILVDDSGFNYAVGDVLQLVGGKGDQGLVSVSAVSARSGAINFKIVNGGAGYPVTDDPEGPNTIDITEASPQTGINAGFDIGVISDTESITTAIDALYPWLDVVIAPYANTVLSDLLDFHTFIVGTIAQLKHVDPGTGYTNLVTIDVHNDFIAGLRIPDPVHGGFKGMNAVISGTNGKGAGAIDAVVVLDSGFGYVNNDQVDFKPVTTKNGTEVTPSSGTCVLSKGVGSSRGHWKDRAGFLNADKYVQDSYFYQQFSYQIRSELSFSKYADIIRKVWHVAGTEMFGRIVLPLTSDDDFQDYDPLSDFHITHPA